MVRDTLGRALEGKFAGCKVLVLIPDHTRTIPLPRLFRMLVEILHDARQLDFMVALGTHPPLDDAQINHLAGITADERQSSFAHIGLLNHTWNKPDALVQIGTITQAQVKDIAGDIWHPSLGGDVPVNINRAVLSYDHILILGPTFPHEVVGFSGGAKYLFPGISGPEMINTTHWLGALRGVIDTIGVKGDGYHIIDRTGLTTSNQLHGVTRMRKISPTTIEAVLTLTDPVAFTRPWVVTKYYDKFTQPGVRAYDYGCAENNRNPVGADGFTLTLGTDGKPIDKPRN